MSLNYYQYRITRTSTGFLIPIFKRKKKNKKQNKKKKKKNASSIPTFNSFQSIVPLYFNGSWYSAGRYHDTVTTGYYLHDGNLIQNTWYHSSKVEYWPEISKSKYKI